MTRVDKYARHTVESGEAVHRPTESVLCVIALARPPARPPADSLSESSSLLDADFSSCDCEREVTSTCIYVYIRYWSPLVLMPNGSHTLHRVCLQGRRAEWDECNRIYSDTRPLNDQFNVPRDGTCSQLSRRRWLETESSCRINPYREMDKIYAKRCAINYEIGRTGISRDILPPAISLTMRETRRLGIGSEIRSVRRLRRNEELRGEGSRTGRRHGDTATNCLSSIIATYIRTYVQRCFA